MLVFPKCLRQVFKYYILRIHGPPKKEYGWPPILFFISHSPTSLLKSDDREMEEGGGDKEKRI